MGPPGREVSWPTASLISGGEQHLNRMQEATVKDYRKVYTLPTQQVASASLRQLDTGGSLQVRWDAITAPYLGVWIDEGTYTRDTTVALEPASGYYDSLADAIDNQRVATVPQGEHRQWWLTVSLSKL